MIGLYSVLSQGLGFLPLLYFAGEGRSTTRHFVFASQMPPSPTVHPCTPAPSGGLQFWGCMWPPCRRPKKCVCGTWLGVRVTPTPRCHVTPSPVRLVDKRGTGLEMRTTYHHIACNHAPHPSLFIPPWHLTYFPIPFRTLGRCALHIATPSCIFPSSTHCHFVATADILQGSSVQPTYI